MKQGENGPRTQEPMMQQAIQIRRCELRSIFAKCAHAYGQHNHSRNSDGSHNGRNIGRRISSLTTKTDQVQKTRCQRIGSTWPTTLSVSNLQSRQPGTREKQIKLRRLDDSGGPTKLIGDLTLRTVMLVPDHRTRPHIGCWLQLQDPQSGRCRRRITTEG